MIVIEERKICRMIEGLFQFDKECEWNDAIEEAMHRFVNLPTIEAEPVRHGRWEYVNKRLARGGYVDASECSVCHKRIMPHLEPNYCPNCGAKMDGGGGDEGTNR